MGRLSRFLRLAVASTLVLAACQSQAPAASPTAAPGPTGKLVVAITSLREETFLPWTGPLARKTYTTPIFDFLVHAKGETGEYVPSLAKSWDVSADRLTWTIKLRDGVKWHDGTDFTSADVAYTIQRYTDKDSLGFSANFFRNALAGVETPDPLTVVLKVKAPQPALVGELSSYGSLWIAPKKYVTEVGDKVADQKPIGTGPYKFVRLAPAQDIEYEAVPAHWRVVPEFKTLLIRAIPEESARLAALRTKEVDISVVSTDSSAALERDGFRIKEVKQSYGTMFMFGALLNPTDKRYAKPTDPWADQRVRKALNIAIDRDAIAKSFYQGRATPHPTGWMFPGWQELGPYKYDVAEAKRLLAEAGFPSGFTVQMPAYPLSPGTELPQLVEAVANYWDKIGVKAKIVPIDFANYRREWGEGKTAGRISVMRMPLFPDWGTNADSYFGTAGPLPSYSDAETDAALRAALSETDVAARAKKFGELGKLLRSKDAMVGIAIVNDTTALGDQVGTWTPLAGTYPMYWEYVTHKQPFKLFRLFEP